MIQQIENHAPIHRTTPRRRDRGQTCSDRCCHRPAGRRRDGAFHLALSQRGDGRAGRYSTAFAGRAAALSARAGRAPRGDHRLDHRAGQDDAGVVEGGVAGHRQDASGRPVSAVQAEAPHQGADRAGGGAGTVGGCVAGEPDAESGSRRRPSICASLSPARRAMPTPAWRMPRRRWMARGRS